VQGIGNLSPTIAAPTILRVGPRDGASRVALCSPIIITFSEPMLPSTINAFNIVLKDAFDQLVAVIITYDPNNQTVTIIPGKLATYMNYYIRISPEVSSCAGVPLEAPFKSQFTTGIWH